MVNDVKCYLHGVASPQQHCRVDQFIIIDILTSSTTNISRPVVVCGSISFSTCYLTFGVFALIRYKAFNVLNANNFIV